MKCYCSYFCHMSPKHVRNVPPACSKNVQFVILNENVLHDLQTAHVYLQQSDLPHFCAMKGLNFCIYTFHQCTKLLYRIMYKN